MLLVIFLLSIRWYQYQKWVTCGLFRKICCDLCFISLVKSPLWPLKDDSPLARRVRLLAQSTQVTFIRRCLRVVRKIPINLRSYLTISKCWFAAKCASNTCKYNKYQYYNQNTYSRMYFKCFCFDLTYDTYLVYFY